MDPINIRLYYGGKFVTRKGVTTYEKGDSDFYGLALHPNVEEVCYFEFVHWVKTELGYQKMGKLWFRKDSHTLFTGRQELKDDGDIVDFLFSREDDGWYNLYLVHEDKNVDEDNRAVRALMYGPDKVGFYTDSSEGGSSSLGSFSIPDSLRSDSAEHHSNGVSGAQSKDVVSNPRSSTLSLSKSTKNPGSSLVKPSKPSHFAPSSSTHTTPQIETALTPSTQTAVQKPKKRRLRKKYPETNPEPEFETQSSQPSQNSHLFNANQTEAPKSAAEKPKRRLRKQFLEPIPEFETENEELEVDCEVRDSDVCLSEDDYEDKNDDDLFANSVDLQITETVKKSLVGLKRRNSELEYRNEAEEGDILLQSDEDLNDSDEDLKEIHGSDDDEIEYPVFNPSVDFKQKIKLSLGLKFPSRFVFRKALQHHAIENGYNYYFLHNKSH